MDERRQAWAVFAVMTAMYCFSQFYRMSTAVIAVDLDREFHLGPGRLSLLGGAFYYAFAAVQVPLGLTLDRWGAKRIVVAATVLAAAGAALFGTSSSWGGLLAGRLMMGLGMSPVLMGSFKLFAGWFPASLFGSLSGLILALGTLGAMLAATPLAALVGWVGWRASFLLFSVLTLVAAGGIVWVVADRSDPEAAAAPGSSASLPRLGQVFRLPSFWAMVPLALTGYASLASIQGLWGGPYFMEHLGYSRAETGNILLALGVSSALGSVAGGVLSDRWVRSRKWVVVAGSVAGGGFLLPLVGVAAPGGPLGWSAALACFGFLSAFRALMYAHVKESVPASAVGTAVTAVNFFIMIGPALLQQALGLVLARHPGDYRSAFWFLIAALGVGTLAYLGTRDTTPP